MKTQVKTKTQMKSKKAVQVPTKFAEGLSFKKLFFIFLIGSVIGAIYEDILIYVSKGVWMLHRGVIYGPFNVIYGFGAVVMIWVLAREKYKWWEVFLYGALLGGVVEYLVGFLQEFFTHTTSWDYSNHFLNINGRTTIPIMLIWGLMGLVLVKVLYPPISRLIESIPVKVGNVIFWVLLVFMIFDMLISWTALLRQTLRHNDVPPFTPVGRFYDDYYNDQFLEKYYPNMVRHDKR